jgi:hypothetical protein
MDKIRSALNQLTIEKDGVDGAGIYLYGEAWDFGEMVNNARGRNAAQLNMGGTKVGAFNDRYIVLLQVSLIVFISHFILVALCRLRGFGRPGED